MKIRKKTPLIIFLLALTLGAVFYFSNSNFMKKPKKGNQNFKTVIEGSGRNISIKEEGQKIIKNKSEWQELWNSMFSNQTEKTSPIQVDFKKYLLVAVFSGQKETGGHAIRVESVQNQKDKIVIKVVETSPAENCILTPVLTSPFEIIKIEKSNLPIEFSITKSASLCEE